MIPNGKVAATIMELKNTSPENTSYVIWYSGKNRSPVIVTPSDGSTHRKYKN